MPAGLANLNQHLGQLLRTHGPASEGTDVSHLVAHPGTEQSFPALAASATPGPRNQSIDPPNQSTNSIHQFHQSIVVQHLYGVRRSYARNPYLVGISVRPSSSKPAKQPHTHTHTSPYTLIPIHTYTHTHIRIHCAALVRDFPGIEKREWLHVNSPHGITKTCRHQMNIRPVVTKSKHKHQRPGMAWGHPNPPLPCLHSNHA